MTIEELKMRVGAYRQALRNQTGAAVRFSETGPANMGVIDALVAAIQSLHDRLEALEARVNAANSGMPD
jgi:hypothetical protein